uniref:tRNA aspartic acid methyltransferase 1 n=1 Tax=Leptobrachium leishanense TaxID=445787 RepID=A0A8C5M2C7_9ANUR
MSPLRVLELYSGIGGMHCGLAESAVPAEVVAAVDVNTTANQVYKYNFPDTPLWTKTIEGISLKEFDDLAFDMLLMSPPCQPFTRLQKPPMYILLENVKGFESSIARENLVTALLRCGYRYQEFLLSPTCLGIPNSRLRYFLIAKLQKEEFSFQVTNQLLEDFPTCFGLVSSSTTHSSSRNVNADLDLKSTLSDPPRDPKQDTSFLYKLETPEELERKQSQDNDSSIRTLDEFLEKNIGDINQYFLPSRSLLRYALILDIVQPSSRRSTCFTKGYGHYVEGTGSVLQTATDVEISSAYEALETVTEEEKLAKLSTLKMRYFTPREIANLHGFPPQFGFPEKTTTKQCYRLLGNSLNVHIVAKLITVLLQSH